MTWEFALHTTYNTSTAFKAGFHFTNVSHAIPTTPKMKPSNDHWGCPVFITQLDQNSGGHCSNVQTLVWGDLGKGKILVYKPSTHDGGQSAPHEPRKKKQICCTSLQGHLQTSLPTHKMTGKDETLGLAPIFNIDKSRYRTRLLIYLSRILGPWSCHKMLEIWKIC